MARSTEKSYSLKSFSKFSALCCSAASMWHPNMLLFGIESLSRNILCNHKIDMYSYFLATFFMYHVIKLNTRTWNHSSVPIGSYFWQLFWHFLKILRFNLCSGSSVLMLWGQQTLWHVWWGTKTSVWNWLSKGNYNFQNTKSTTMYILPSYLDLFFELKIDFIKN